MFDSNSSSNDRQDKGADHYSDMIRNPSRSVKVYNKLMWNERRQKMDLSEIDRIKKRSFAESKKLEKVYMEKLAELNETKRVARVTNTAKSQLLSIAIRDKLTLSAKGGQRREFTHEDVKPITVYQMHLIDSKKLITKAKEFIRNLDAGTATAADTDPLSSFTVNNHLSSFENIQPKTPSTAKPMSRSGGGKTPSTTPMFQTEVRTTTTRTRQLDNKAATNAVFAANKPSSVLTKAQRSLNSHRNKNVTQVVNKKVQIFNKTMIDEGFI